MSAYQSTEEYQNRTNKLDELYKLGIEPYPHKFEPSHRSEELGQEFGEEPIGNSEDGASGSTPEVLIAGRLVLFRAMGKNAFGQIQDSTGRVQFMINRDQTSLTGYDGETKPIKVIEKKLDLGDFVGIKGHLFRTQKGELTVYAKEVTLLCKSLLPLPDKHAGLHDKETRYRKRWLDLISNRDVMDTFVVRSRILKAIREHCEGFQFMEVETPVLQSIYGGAQARPFTTFLHAMHQEMFLRISIEIALKKLVVGGIERVYEIGKVFRNEGIDRNHNPEFTMLEAYAAYWDYQDMMLFVETLFEKIALALFNSTKFSVVPQEGHDPVEIDVKTPWPRLTMKEAIAKFGDLDVDAMSDKGMREFLKHKAGEEDEQLAQMPRGILIANIFELVAEPHLMQPHHITEHPIETTPLCKPHRDPQKRDAGLIERFESYILTHEICNAYSELNDPVIQRQLLEGQAERREQGDLEANPLDEEFIEAICQGMPPCGGLGIGIDRLVMIFTNSPSIRDVLYFPWMKPQETAKES